MLSSVQSLFGVSQQLQVHHVQVKTEEKMLSEKIHISDQETAKGEQLKNTKGEKEAEEECLLQVSTC